MHKDSMCHVGRRPCHVECLVADYDRLKNVVNRLSQPSPTLDWQKDIAEVADDVVEILHRYRKAMKLDEEKATADCFGQIMDNIVTPIFQQRLTSLLTSEEAKNLSALVCHNQAQGFYGFASPDTCAKCAESDWAPPPAAKLCHALWQLAQQGKEGE